MKKMFKNIFSLVSVIMYSDKNCKIISLESTFENCQNLYDFEINGFDTSELTSLNKLFFTYLFIFLSKFNFFYISKDNFLS